MSCDPTPVSKMNAVNMVKPLVSICIPSFNGAHLIWRAIESAINQSYSNLEIIIVDDCSSDDIDKVVEIYAQKDSRIKYSKNLKNLGLGLNFLRAVNLAKGEFIQCLNQDDWLDRDYIKNKVVIFNKFPDVAFVSSVLCNYKLQIGIKEPVLQNRTVYKPGFYTSRYMFKNFYRKVGLIGWECMARRSDILDNFPTRIPNNFGYDDLYMKKGMVIDSLGFLNILVHYHHFYYESSVFYNNLSHAHNTSKNFGFQVSKLSDNVRFAHVNLIGFGFFYENQVPNYLSRYRIFMGCNVICTVIINFITGRASGSFLESLKVFFHDYKLFEKLAVICITPFTLIKRAVSWMVRRVKKDKSSDGLQFAGNSN